MGCMVELYDKNNEFVGYIGWKYNKNGTVSKNTAITDNIAYALLYGDQGTRNFVNYMHYKDDKYKNCHMKLVWDGRGLDPNTISFPEDDKKKVEVKFNITKTVIDNSKHEVSTVKLNKYKGHQTTKYNDISVSDYFVLNKMRHAVLSHSIYSNKNKKIKYVVREDGEVFSLSENGEMKLKAQYFAESGGVKNKARRAAGKGGGSVYKKVILWNKYNFLTHKLVKEYVTHEKSINEYYISNGTCDSIVKTNKKAAIDERFYRGQMPDGFNKRCYKA